MAYVGAQNYSAARAVLQEAIEGFEAQEGQATLLAARALRGLGVAQRELGDAALAKETLETARSILEARGKLSSEEGSRCLLALGDACLELDEFEEAVECFELVSLNAEVGKASTTAVDVDDLFQKLEEARRQLRHGDAEKLFGPPEESDDTKPKRKSMCFGIWISPQCWRSPHLSGLLHHAGLATRRVSEVSDGLSLQIALQDFGLKGSLLSSPSM
ncbi:hypothetical protein AK812_SmicGene10899 [Symbiodinium microadriaticum]|uniref:Tetratricopeptide repeat protein 28 n=1 Tax=Symbiodinium microadriaticum TaxID=2951 RepID=A0A1Q9EEM0_SYMMI|nr:hypothetical protein AK812_SmicGene10899 [Symbiodinium microadriaticum]